MSDNIDDWPRNVRAKIDDYYLHYGTDGYDEWWDETGKYSKDFYDEWVATGRLSPEQLVAQHDYEHLARAWRLSPEYAYYQYFLSDDYAPFDLAEPIWDDLQNYMATRNNSEGELYSYYGGVERLTPAALADDPLPDGYKYVKYYGNNSNNDVPSDLPRKARSQLQLDLLLDTFGKQLEEDKERRGISEAGLIPVTGEDVYYYVHTHPDGADAASARLRNDNSNWAAYDYASTDDVKYIDLYDEFQSTIPDIESNNLRDIIDNYRLGIPLSVNDFRRYSDYSDAVDASNDPAGNQFFTPVLDLDGNGKVDALTDGLLLLRYTFGLRGSQLASGALAADAIKTAEEVERYLEDPEVQKLLDLDDSGKVDALTDGLLLLRRSFGLRGKAMEEGAVAGGSPYDPAQGNVEWGALEAKIDRLNELMIAKDGYGNYNSEILIDRDGNYVVEQGLGTYVNTRAPDSDADGIPDIIDALPENPNEWTDIDRDGYGANSDPDDTDDTIYDVASLTDQASQSAQRYAEARAALIDASADTRLGGLLMYERLRYMQDIWQYRSSRHTLEAHLGDDRPYSYGGKSPIYYISHAEDVAMHNQALENQERAAIYNSYFVGGELYTITPGGTVNMTAGEYYDPISDTVIQHHGDGWHEANQWYSQLMQPENQVLPMYVNTSLEFDVSWEHGHDATRLWMKLPGEPIVPQIRATPHESGEGFTSFQAEPQPLHHRENRTALFGEEYGSAWPYSDTDIMGRDGFWVDISGGAAPVGSYSMMWFEYPELRSDGFVQDALLSMAQIVAAIMGFVDPNFNLFKANLIIAGAKVALGRTLTTEDYFPVAMAGLTEFFTVQDVVPPEVAKIMSADAYKYYIEMGYSISDAMDKASQVFKVATEGIGLFGTTVAQTQAIISAALSGDLDEAARTLLVSFGGGYIEKSLKAIGISQSTIDGINPTLRKSMDDIVHKMVTKDLDFDEALLALGLDYVGSEINAFKDQFELDDKLKAFFDEYAADLKTGVDTALGAFNDIELVQLFEELMEGADIGFIENIPEFTQAFTDQMSLLSNQLDSALKNIDRSLLRPIADSAQASFSKFIGKSTVFPDGVPESTAGILDEVKAGWERATGKLWNNLDDALKDGIESALISQILDGDVDEASLVRSFNRELITDDIINEALANSNIANALSPQLIGNAVRHTLNTAMLNGDTSGLFWDALTQPILNGIETAINTGNYTQLIIEADAAMTRGTDAYRDVKLASIAMDEAEANLIDANSKIVELQGRSDARQPAVDAALAAAALPGASDEDRTNARNLANEHLRLSQEEADEISSLQTEAFSHKKDFQNARSEFNVASEDVGDEFVILDENTRGLFNDIDRNAVLSLHPNFNAKTYALMSGVSIDEAYSHYLSYGLYSGAPTTPPEYNERLNVALSELTTYAFDNVDGVQEYLASDAELSWVRNGILSYARDYANAEGIPLLAYLESNKDNPDFLYISPWETIITQSYNSAYDQEEYLPNGQPVFEVQSIGEVTQIQQTNAYINVRDMLSFIDGFDPAEKDAELDQLVNNNLTWAARTETEGPNWGPPSARMILEDGEFKYVPIGGGLTLTDMAFTRPAEFLDVLGALPNRYAQIAEEARREEARLQYEVSDEFIGPLPEYAVPDEELPWTVRIARHFLSDSKEIEDFWRDELIRLEGELENATNPDDIAFLKGEIFKAGEAWMTATESRRRAAEWIVEVPAGLTTNITTGIQSIYKASTKARIEDRADIIWQATLVTDGVEAADEAKQEYLDRSLPLVDDTPITDEIIRQSTMLESLAYGYAPDWYTDGIEDMYATWDAAVGPAAKIEAVFGTIKNAPDIFLSRVVGTEIVEELYTLGGAKLIGVGTRTLSNALDLGEDVVDKFTDAASLGSNVVGQALNEYGAVVNEAYTTVTSALQGRVNPNTGKEYTAQEIEEVAFDAGTNAGATTIVTMALTGSWAFKLESDILTNLGREYGDTLANRSLALAQTIGKEAVAEAIQEAVGVGMIELAIYNAGVTDRDVAGDMTLAATLGGIVGGTVTASLAPLGINMFPGLAESNDPLAAIMLTQNEDIRTAAQQGDVDTVKSVLIAANLATLPLYTEVLNVVDDDAYVSRVEAQVAYENLGLDDPNAEDIELAVELAEADGFSDFDLDEQLRLAWEMANPDELLGSGRTTAQHYDIIQHIRNMIDGKVPLDPAFNYNGDSTVSEADIEEYKGKLPKSEQNLLDNYDAEEHVPTGIIKDLGGSLMNIEELNTLNKIISDVIKDNPTFSNLQIINAVQNNAGLPAGILTGQIDAAVGTQLNEKASREAFATQVVDELVNNGSISTLDSGDITTALGNKADETGIYEIISEVKEQIGLDNTDATSLVELINELVGQEGTLDAAAGTYSGGDGLLGTLAQAGVDAATARATIGNVLGIDDGENSTGLYAIARDASNTVAAIARIESEYGTIDTAVGNIATTLANNIGMAKDDPNNTTGGATGLHAAIGSVLQKIADNKDLIGLLDSSDAPGDQPSGLYKLIQDEVGGLLGDNVDFPAFQRALVTAVNGEVTAIKTALGTPPVFARDLEGNITYSDEAKTQPIFEVDGAPSGLLGELYQAMQYEGALRDDAVTAVQTAIKNQVDRLNNAAVSAAGTAASGKIKSEILDVYFPARPDNYIVGRDAAREQQYIQELVNSGQYDEAYDFNGDAKIDAADGNLYVTQLSDEDKLALGEFNAYRENTTAITPLLENINVQTGVNFDALQNQIQALDLTITSYAEQAIINQIGMAANDPNNDTGGATGLFKLVEASDDSVLDILGERGDLQADGSIDGGKGLLKQLQQLGYDAVETASFLEDNIGSKEEGTGLYAEISTANETLGRIEDWFTAYVDSVIELTDGVARGDAALDVTTIKNTLRDQLVGIAKAGDLVTEADITTAIDAVIANTDLDLALKGKALSVEDIKEDLRGQLGAIAKAGDLVTEADITGAIDSVISVDDLDLALSDKALSVEDIKDDLRGQLGAIAKAGDLVTEADITTAIDAVIANTDLDLALKGKALSVEDIKEDLRGQLGAIAKAGDLVTEADITGAIDSVISVDDLDLALSDKALSVEDIKDDLRGQLGAIAKAGDLVTEADITTAIDAVIANTDLDLALKGKALSVEDIKEDLRGQLGAIAKAGDLVTEADITGAIDSVISADDLDLALSDKALSVEDIKDDLRGQLGAIAKAGDLVTEADITTAIDAVIANTDLDLALKGKALSVEDIKEDLRGQLGAIAKAGDLVTEADITGAIDSVISADDLDLALSDKALSVEDIKDDLRGQLGAIAKAGDLVTEADITTAIDAVIANTDLDLALKGKALSVEDIKEDLRGQLGAIAKAGDLVTEADITGAIDSVISVDDLDLALSDKALSVEDIKDDLRGQLGAIAKAGDLVTEADITTAIDAVIANTDLDLALKGKALSVEDIKEDLRGQLGAIAKAGDLVTEADITGAIDSVISADDLDLALSDKALSVEDIKDDLRGQLGAIAKAGDLVTEADITTAIDAVIANTDLDLALKGKALSVEDIKEDLRGQLGAIAKAGDLVTEADITGAIDSVISADDLDLALSDKALSVEDIKDDLRGQLGAIAKAGDLVTEADITTAIDAVIANTDLDLALKGKALSVEDIKEDLRGQLGAIAKAGDLVTEADITGAIDSVISADDLDLALSDKALSVEDIKDDLRGQLGAIAKAGDLVTEADITTAIDAVIANTDLDLALKGKALSVEDIKEDLRGQLGAIAKAGDLVTEADITGAIDSVISADDLDLALSDKALSVEDIKDDLRGQLGAIAKAGDLVTEADITTAIDAVIANTDLDLALKGKALSVEDIKEDLRGQLGAIAKAGDLVTEADITGAIDSVISADDLDLALSDKALSVEDIKDDLRGQLGAIAKAGDLVTEADITTAIDAVIANTDLDLALKGKALSVEDIKEDLRGQLGAIAKAGDLVTEADITGAIDSVISADDLDLALSDKALSVEDIKDDLRGQLGAIAKAGDLVTEADITTAIDAVIANTDLDLALKGKALSVEDIKEDLRGQLGAIAKAGDLVTEADITGAIDSVISADDLDLALSDKALSVEDIKDDLRGQLGAIAKAGDLVTEADITTAIDAVIANTDLDLALKGKALSVEDIKEDLRGQLGAIAKAGDLVTEADITGAIDSVISADDLDLALSDKALSVEDIKDDLRGQLGAIAKAGDLVTEADITTAIDAVIANTDLDLALKGKALSVEDIKEDLRGQLGAIAKAGDLVTEADITGAIDSVISADDLDLALSDKALSVEDIKDDLRGQLGAIAKAGDLVTEADIVTAVNTVVASDDLDLALSASAIDVDTIAGKLRQELGGLVQAGQLITEADISTAVDSVIGTSEDQAELDRLSQLDTRDDTEQAEFERLSSLLYLATPDDVLSAEELATAVQTDELKNVATVDSLLDAGDISGAVNAAIGADGLDLATKGDVLDPDEVAAAVTTQLGGMIASGETVSAATIQDAIANQTVAIGQVVSAEQAGLATAEQVEGIGVGVQEIATLLGKPVNEVTQEDVEIANGYIEAIEAEQTVAEEDLLRYDVDGVEGFTQEDVALLEAAAQDQDYTGFAPDAQFRGTATGILGELQQERDARMEAELAVEQQRQADIERKQTEERLADQEELSRALLERGTTRVGKGVDPARIDNIYDIGGTEIFADQEQGDFYRSASPFGDNILDQILNPQPQRRARGGQIKDPTDEILKIIGDK